MCVATVVLDIPTQAFEQGFSYEVPSDLEGISVGCAVLWHLVVVMRLAL